jgi:hypothetical protein
MPKPELKLFTDPSLLWQVNRRLLARLFGHFEQLPAGHRLPNPDGELYPEALAYWLQQAERLPDELSRALAAIEASASANDAPVDPDLDNPDVARLSQAIQQWLQSPAPQIPPPQPAAVEIRISDNLICESAAANCEPTAAPCCIPPCGPRAADSDEDEIERLARLSTLEYDRVRREEAERLNLRVRVLDAQVAKCRALLRSDVEANAVKLPVLEPWPEPVDGGEFLNEVGGRFSLYLALCAGAGDAMTYGPDTPTHSRRSIKRRD